MEGRVQVNGAERDLKNFRKRSAYITQKDHLLSNLTVDEYMLAAAHLKLGNGVSNKKKESIVSNLHTVFLDLSDFRNYSQNEHLIACR